MVSHITIFTYNDVLDEYCNPEIVEKINLTCFIQQHYHIMKPPYQQTFF